MRQAVSADRPWFFASNTLTIYTGTAGAGGDPTTIYGDVASQISDSTQRDYGLYIVNSNNMRIENIRYSAPTTACIMTYSNATNPMTNITFDNFTMIAMHLRHQDKRIRC